MFALRTICPNYPVSNKCLGDEYSVVRIENKKDFDVLLKSWSLGKDFEDLIFAFVVYNGGSESIPLYTTHQHFICNQNGSTFEKIKP